MKSRNSENLNKLARPKNELVVINYFKDNNWPAKKVIYTIRVMKPEIGSRAEGLKLQTERQLLLISLRKE
ncbi:hypothetical protein [Aequorivita sp. Q41]|uniref:hypothetical protein n=1 Tax=Aequorivita sp. Q41 TaxID=3153300 RepID=UPI0032422A13